MFSARLLDGANHALLVVPEDAIPYRTFPDDVCDDLEYVCNILLVAVSSTSRDEVDLVLDGSVGFCLKVDINGRILASGQHLRSYLF